MTLGQDDLAMNTPLFFRLTIPILAVSLLLFALGVSTAWYVQRSQRDISDILDSNLASMRAGEEFELGIREARTQLNRFLLTGDRKHLGALPGIRKNTDYWLAESERLATTTPEQALIEKVTAGYQRLFAEVDRLHENPEAGVDAGMHQYIEDILSQEILPSAHAYLDLNEELAKQTSNQNRILSDRMVLGLLLLGTCGAVAGLLGGYGIARGVSRSLVQLSVPIRDAAGKLNEVVGPITVAAGSDLKEMEGTLRSMAVHIGQVVAQLQESQQSVLRAEQLSALGRLAAGLAHELRNPLMAMKTLVQSASYHADEPSLSGRDLAILDDEILRMEQLLQSCLDLARPPRMERLRFVANAVLEQTAALVGNRAQQQNVELRCCLPPEPIQIEADRGEIRQLVLNLLLNALEALPQGGAVTLEATLEDAGSSDEHGLLRHSAKREPANPVHESAV